MGAPTAGELTGFAGDGGVRVKMYCTGGVGGGLLRDALGALLSGSALWHGSPPQHALMVPQLAQAAVA